MNKSGKKLTLTDRKGWETLFPVIKWELQPWELCCLEEQRYCQTVVQQNERMGKWRGKTPRLFSPPVLQSLLVPPTDQPQPQARAQESRWWRLQHPPTGHRTGRVGVRSRATGVGGDGLAHWLLYEPRNVGGCDSAKRALKKVSQQKPRGAKTKTNMSHEWNWSIEMWRRWRWSRSQITEGFAEPCRGV